MIRSLLFSLLFIGWFYGLKIDWPGSDITKINVAVGPFVDEVSCNADLLDAVKFFQRFFGNNIQVGACQKLGEGI